MSKRDLKKYLAGMEKEQIEKQFLELYDKFVDVKTYYDFIFNPKEDKLVAAAKIKISNEYFPIKTKRAKLRRSTAQKYIKHFLILGVDAYAVADLMLFSIETAQRYAAKREMRYNSFYKSMLNSFEQVVNYAIANGIVNDYRERIIAIFDEAKQQKWENYSAFERVADHVKFA